jgi:hypothetical protein
MTNQPAAPIESPEELARLREDLIAFYRPVNSQERIALEHVAHAQQSMFRAARLETSLFTAPPGKELHSILETEAFKFFLRFQAQAERAYRRALDEFSALQASRKPQPGPGASASKPHAVPPPVVPVPTAAPPTTAPPDTAPLAAKPAAGPVSVPAPAAAAAASRGNVSGNLALRL